MANISKSHHEKISEAVSKVISTNEGQVLNKRDILKLQQDLSVLNAIYKEYLMHIEKAKSLVQRYEKQLHEARMHLKEKQRKVKKKLPEKALSKGK